MSHYGKAAYEAYRERFAATHPEYEQWLQNHGWDDMELVEQEAWVKAAEAAFRERDADQVEVVSMDKAAEHL